MEKSNSQHKNIQGPLAEILQQTRSLIAFHQDMGLSYPLTPKIKKFLESSGPDICKANKRPKKTAKKKQSATPGGPAITLADVRRELGDCTRCPLHGSRKHLIFGSKDVTHVPLLIVCDPPTREDEKAEKPISGAAEKLLLKMIAAIGLDQEKVYITNVVKCCPPEDRSATAQEIGACQPFLARQIEAVSPKIIYALGPLAGRSLLKTEAPLLRLRGRFHEFHGISLMPSYHPEFLLRHPDMKKPAWHDLQMIQRKIAAINVTS